MKMKFKKLFLVILILSIIVLVIYVFSFWFQKSKSDLKVNRTCMLGDDFEKPLLELFSPENLARENEAERLQVEEERKNRKPIANPIREANKHLPKGTGHWSPEELGENFNDYSPEKLLAKLTHGDKIEQRKAANELWKQHTETKLTLSDEESKKIVESVSRYLRYPFEISNEGFDQNLRLWHLAVPGLLKNVTDERGEVYENAARLLSKMKTSEIIDQLIAASEKADSAPIIKKYIFALEYMKWTNPCHIKARPQLSEEETQKLYQEKALPQIEKLKKKLVKQ